MPGSLSDGATAMVGGKLKLGRWKAAAALQLLSGRLVNSSSSSA